MEKILAVYCAPQFKAQSRTYALMCAFVNAYQESHPDAQIEWLDLNDQSDIINDPRLNEHNVDNRNDADPIYAKQLCEADKLIIGTPVNYLTISALCKSWLEHVVRRGYTHTHENGVVKGLLSKLKVQILITKGEGKNETDVFSSDYLRHVFEYWGAKVNPAVIIANTDSDENKNKTPKEIIAPHLRTIKEAAGKF